MFKNQYASASGRYQATKTGRIVQVFDAVVVSRDGTRQIVGTFKLKRDALAAAEAALCPFCARDEECALHV